MGRRKLEGTLAKIQYDTCGHAGATWRDLGAGGFAMSCDPCLAAEDAAFSFVASGDASAVCGDCGEDLMGGGPHAAGCPRLCRLCDAEEAVEGDRNGYCAACAAEDAKCGN